MRSKPKSTKSRIKIRKRGKKTELMFKLFTGLPGHLRQLIMHFGSGRDAYFIKAMAVPVLAFAL